MDSKLAGFVEQAASIATSGRWDAVNETWHFTKIADAAGEIGIAHDFNLMNKFLSNFAHTPQC
jgi:hypothetical protein